MLRSLAILILASIFGSSAAGQSSHMSSPAQAQNPALPAEPKKPKKVWTNDNLSDANGAVSVVGNSKAGSKTKSNTSKLSDAQLVSLRKQLEKLQAQMADADKQIVELTNFSKGEPSKSAGGIKLGKGYNREPIEVQIRALQEKKKDLQSKMDALLDEARKKGIEPGQLR
jgi:chaperonin cofactor prefoldin